MRHRLNAFFQLPQRSSYEPVHSNESNNSNTISLSDHHHHHFATTATNDQQKLSLVLFFLAGFLNNISFVIILSVAKSVVEGGTAVVFLANVLPGLLVKLTAPYWFDAVSYRSRLSAAAANMAAGIVVLGVSFAHHENNNNVVWWPLLGIALVSLQCGLGEASLLALAGQWDNPQTKNVENERLRRMPEGNVADECSSEEGEDSGVPMHQPPPSRNQEAATATCQFATGMTSLELDVTNLATVANDDTNNSSNTTTAEQTTKGAHVTAWSAGTGLAGPAGFGWKILWNEFVGLSLRDTLLLSLLLAAAYSWVCQRILWERTSEQRQQETTTVIVHDEPGAVEYEHNDSTDFVKSPHEWTTEERWHHTLALWPYILPLFTVYAAEYACQAGAWTAMGFPVADPNARNHFYEISNALYQAGVFISRSSGTWFPVVSMSTLWLMPALQVINLIFFSVTAAAGQDMWWYRPVLLHTTSFYTGLLGGAVYVHGYKRIVADFARHRQPEDPTKLTMTEFALSTTSVAEGMGIVLANVMSLFLQSCLYARHALSGAVVECPMR